MFWPTTFAERGVIVPFTTPVLAHARVRPSEADVLAVLVSGMSDGPSIYVIPWEALPTAFSLTVHDRSLAEEIEFMDATNPSTIRMAALRVARTGLAGADAARVANAQIEAEEMERLVTYFDLVKHAHGSMVGGTFEIDFQDVIDPAGQGAVRAIIEAIGKAIDLPRSETQVRIEALSKIIYPVGIAGYAG